MALNLGGIIRLTYAVKNDLGVLSNPSTATLTITQPDGTTASPSVSLPPAVTGQLVVDFTPTQSGLHSVRWLTTGPGTSEPDTFVAEPNQSMLVSVDEALARLNAANLLTSDPNREYLQWLCMVATDAVERDLARVLVRRTVVATYNGGVDAVRLYSTPVLSVTSVVEAGTSLSSTPGVDWVLDTSTSLLYRGSSTSLMSWALGRQNIVVTYIAGYLDPPRSVREVALSAVQEMWQSSQQAPHSALLEESAELAIQSAVAALPGPLRGAYNRLRVKGLA